jgi:MAD (mothers against decapentaplegic) family protein 4
MIKVINKPAIIYCLDLSGLTLQSGTPTNGSGRIIGLRDEYTAGGGGISPSPPGSSQVSSSNMDSDVSGNSPAVTVQHHLPPLYHQQNPVSDVSQQPTVSQAAGMN